MWQVYQYAHGKLKLTKDLKTAESHLRVSLIDQQEIENMGKIYKDRKNYYKIDSESFTTPAFVQQSKGEDTTVHLSYKEKVQLYRRRVQNQKLDNKYNNLFKKTEKRRHKMRNPILYKLLQQFEDEYKHEDNLQIRDDLKESEKYLQMIKINTNRRAKFQTTTEQAAPNRPRFISLENSKPEKEGQSLPNWIDYLEGRMSKPSKAASGINIAQLQNTFESVISKNAAVKAKKTRKPSKEQANHVELQSPTRSQEAGFKLTHLDSVDQNQLQKNFVCQRCEKSCPQKKKEEDKEDTHLHRNLSSNRQTEARKTTNKYFKRNSSKPEQNIAVLAERTFSKSENYSKNVIATMGNFYQAKNHKKEDYQKMVFYLKKDRPLTSNIRRSNYRVISAGNIQEIKKYRSMSQKERLNLKNKNHEFYLSLLRQLEGHNVEEMTLTGKIMDRLRKVLSENYIVSSKHFEYISQPALYQDRDQMSESILKQSQQFIHKHQQQ